MPVSWNEPINCDSTFWILALVQPSLRSILDKLKNADNMRLVVCSTVEELVRVWRQAKYSVVLLPADNLASREWFSLWGVVSLLDPRPSILVYALTSDSKMWASVMAAGGFDVITAPFSHEKFSLALQSAEDDFHRRIAS
jgi:DNA-binding NtrC family response regulator